MWNFEKDMHQKKGDRGGKKNYVFVPRTLTVLAFDLGWNQNCQ